MSIRLRLTLVQTLLLGLVLTAFAIIVYAAVSAQEMNQLNYELRMLAEDTQQRAYGRPPREARFQAVGEGGNPFGRDTVRESVPARVPHERFGAIITDRFEGSPVMAELVGSGGDVIVRTAGLDAQLPLSPGFLKAVKAAGSHSETVTIDGEPVRVLGLRLESRPIGDDLALIVATSLASVEDTLQSWRITLSLIVLGTTAVAAAIAWLMATSALRPVDRMASVARAIGHSADFDGRLPETGPMDELGRLARTFNEMLDQLSGANATQRRFLADASHELRTPLTAIATNLDILRGDGVSDPAERAEMLRAAARETDRMSRLVSDLLTLARADAGVTPSRRRLALDTLVLDVYQQQRSLSGAVTLTLGEWEQVEVDADPDRLKQVILNLVDNAIRYTPAGGTVTLDLQRQGPEVVLRVTDTGVGIAPEHQVRIFDRFYRVDQPRTRQSGGTGLGLAIAREMAEAHGGRIELTSTPGEGSTFSLILPALPDPPRPGPASVTTTTRQPQVAAG